MGLQHPAPEQAIAALERGLCLYSPISRCSGPVTPPTPTRDTRCGSAAPTSAASTAWTMRQQPGSHGTFAERIDFVGQP
jgi:hypothetical protein